MDLLQETTKKLSKEKQSLSEYSALLQRKQAQAQKDSEVLKKHKDYLVDKLKAAEQSVKKLNVGQD